METPQKQDKQDKKFIVHIQLRDTEMEVPVFAASIEQATAWAEEQYESQGFVINRVSQRG